MAERPVDRLLPAALALVAGVTAFAWIAAAVVADFSIGRPSPQSAFGIVAMLPLAIFAAIVGYALGHFAGMALRRRGLTPVVPMRLYRFVMAIALIVAAVIGAAAGAAPVLRNERRNQPRVIAGEGQMDKRSGRPENCGSITPASVACDLGAGQSSSSMLWNGRDVTVGCTRDGVITVSDAGSGIVASADLRSFEYVTRLQAAAMRQDDGREAMAMLAQLRAAGRREMLLVFDADGRLTYQELVARSDGRTDTPLSVCATGDRDTLIVDLGAPVSYQAR